MRKVYTITSRFHGCVGTGTQDITSAIRFDNSDLKGSISQSTGGEHRTTPEGDMGRLLQKEKARMRGMEDEGKSKTSPSTSEKMSQTVISRIRGFHVCYFGVWRKFQDPGPPFFAFWSSVKRAFASRNFEFPAICTFRGIMGIWALTKTAAV